MTSPDVTAAFLRQFPPHHTAPVPAEVLDRYAERLPEPVLALWRAGGFGTYGGGLLEVIDPGEYQEILDGWLGLRDASQTRIPFLRSAFGVLFYWRRLGEQQPDGTYEAYDVAYLNPHDSYSDVSAWDAEAFFGGLTAPGAEDEYDPFRLWPDVQGRAPAELRPGVMYGFTLALRLGGEWEAANLSLTPARAHLLLLLSLAAADDEDEDVQTPTEFRDREAALRADLSATADPAARATLHGRLVRLLERAPQDAAAEDARWSTEQLGSRLCAEYAHLYALDPQPQWLYGQADTLRTYLGDFSAAAALYGALLADGHDPNRARQGLIRCAQFADDHAAVVAHASALLATDASSAGPRLDLARAQQALGAYGDALTHYQFLGHLLYRSDYPLVMRGWAECLILLGDASGAEALVTAHARQALFEQGRVEVLKAGVKAFSAFGDPEVALRFQEQVVQIIHTWDADDEPAEVTLNLYVLAHLRRRAGRHAGALEAVRELLARPDGQRSQYYCLQGNLLAAAGHRREARVSFARARELDPGAPPPARGFLARLFRR
ncbi:GAD-like domain-containing protein [Deinococcus soli (ex Cha et al. 2016)]|uniref:GAD-related domain-containing protein n=2 Tax=Deinococcus soli (ex Cha et al. 2016) TaxID=1309411 RepID=A0AAE4BM25_9DEIO|nr:GAD-like domain-containing protein [Deinococcus soli (ex Cha et al. 2016)]MDR6218630.1 hypothetical protein [Deinococcus soli (ex Cha et al. 2016)]MDR6328427.1 hypothetical protein [Deinococcus soli (ex Cha et al. 2016)]MDR6753038.1 hypothetical protein [Deinococcus soli (ex Cha et al. 2016)]